MHTEAMGSALQCAVQLTFMKGFWRGGAARTEAGGMGVITAGKICVLGRPLLKLNKLAIVMVNPGSILAEHHLTNRVVIRDVFSNAVITKHSAS